MVAKINDRLYSWASDLEEKAAEQARRTSRLPIIAGHVALMPDAHWGLGATVGSVIPTDSAIIPAAVGVDIGCGMAAVRTDRTAEHLPDDLTGLLGRLASVIPNGVGKGHTVRSPVVERTGRAADRWLRHNPAPSEQARDRLGKAREQFGSLGSGNHFAELCLDETDGVWFVLHSGSRGIGNELAQGHISTAKSVAEREGIGLEDPDLAYLVEGTPEFAAYMADLLWAQAYAKANRDAMLDNALPVVFEALGGGREVERIQCHHNYTAREIHGGRELWVTRKGAIRAGKGDLGIIPGSMGASTFIVSGLGSALSYESCAHGAGRRLSRGEAKRQLTVESLETAMGHRTWLVGVAESLLDEHPDAYKDIEAVMADQADLVEIRHRLTQVLNLKGL